jgi:hypothetical protein
MSTCRTLLRTLRAMSMPLSLAAAQEPAASLRGTVTDSIRHGPLVGATIVASRTTAAGAGASNDYTATTDARGKYAINSLAPGIYVLTVEHPWLDSTGLGVPSQTVDLAQRRAATVNLAVPSGATIRSSFCPIAARDSSIGLVAGYVKDVNSDHPVAGARVVFAWSDFDVDRRTARATPRERTAAASTGRDGTFRICGLPVLRTMLMQAQFGDHEATGAVEVQVPVSGVLVETLRLDASAVGSTVIAGTVQRESSERPIAGAHVHLYGAADEVLTAADGSFHLTNVPFGTQSIEVTALGFYPRRFALDVHSTGTGNATIHMLAVATVLDSIRIIAKRSTAPLGSREFDDRSAHGHGQYITEAMIANADPYETSDLLRQVNGLYVLNGTVYSSRGITSLRGNRMCSPTVYINGGPGGTPDDISPTAIHGIEVYASSATAPAMYKGGACGVILIWTK